MLQLHAHTNHLLIGVENTGKSEQESAPPLKAVFQWADSVTFMGLPMNSNTRIMSGKSSGNSSAMTNHNADWSCEEE